MGDCLQLLRNMTSENVCMSVCRCLFKCRLNLKSYGGDNAAIAAEETSCSASLSCSRPEAVNSGSPCDIHGMVGAVCTHTIPVRHTFMDMRGPEQFIYYLVLLFHLVTMVVQANMLLGDVYIDFACRLCKTWQRIVNARRDLTPTVRDACGRLRIIVNWMHGSSHDIACQLQHGGRYAAGAGRKVGENSEQLWSMTKASTSM